MVATDWRPTPQGRHGRRRAARWRDKAAAAAAASPATFRSMLTTEKNPAGTCVSKAVHSRSSAERDSTGSTARVKSLMGGRRTDESRYRTRRAGVSCRVRNKPTQDGRSRQSRFQPPVDAAGRSVRTRGRAEFFLSAALVPRPGALRNRDREPRARLCRRACARRAGLPPVARPPPSAQSFKLLQHRAWPNLCRRRRGATPGARPPSARNRRRALRRGAAFGTRSSGQIVRRAGRRIRCGRSATTALFRQRHLV